MPLIECALIASCKFPRYVPINEFEMYHVVPTHLVDREEEVYDLPFPIWILNHSRILEGVQLDDLA